MGYKAVCKYFGFEGAVTEHFGHVTISVKGEGVIHTSVLGTWATPKPETPRLKALAAAIVVAGPTLKRLLTEPDTFERSIPVFTFLMSGAVIEQKCEVRGKGEMTHCGAVQAGNTHFDTAEEAARAGLNALEQMVWLRTEHVLDAQAELKQKQQERQYSEQALGVLRTAYPALAYEVSAAHQEGAVIAGEGYHASPAAAPVVQK